MREGGTEGQLLLLVRALQQRGVRQRVLLLRREGARLEALEALGVPVVDLRFPKLRPYWRVMAWPGLLRCLRRTVRVLPRGRREVVHGWLFEAAVWAALALRLKRSRSALVTSRRQLGNFREGRRWMQWAQRFANRRTQVVVANAEAVARDARLREGRTLPPVRVVPNAVDLAAIDAVPAVELRREFPRLAACGLVVVCVATLGRAKGWLDLLAAWARVRRALGAVGLLAVGPDGDAGEALRREALGASWPLVLAGPRLDVPGILKGADLAVLASHEEGMPNAVLEAMACRRAVVATRVGGIAECIEDGVTGMLVPPRDPRALAEAMITLLRDEPRRRAMGEAGRARIGRMHGLGAMADGHLAVYREAVARRRR